MAEISPAAAISLPLVFSDGFAEIDAGAIPFDPSLGFEKLQFLISQKIGIDPHAFAVFLSRRKNPRSPEFRKIPLLKSSDLTAVTRERNCFFLAVSKQQQPPRPPKRGRRRKPRQHLEDCHRIPTLLRRDPAAMPELRRPQPEFTGQGLRLGLMGYEDKIRELQRGRDMYLYTNPYIYGRVSGGMNQNKIVCEQCLSKERPIPFHPCVYDAVTVGFRSPAGPIERPSNQVRNGRFRFRDGF